MNSVNLIGNLTREPEIRQTTDGGCVASLSVAINRMNEGADYPRVVVFGKQAETCANYLHKGSKVGISGRLQTGSYVNKDGVKIYTTDVVANRVEFLNRVETPEEETQEGFDEKKWKQLDEDIPF